MRKGIAFALVFALIFVVCGGKKEGGLKEERSNEELIQELFEAYKTAYQNQDVDAITPLIASTYWDKYNTSRDAYLTWIQGFFGGWEWKEAVEINIAGSITVEPGWIYTHGRQWDASAYNPATRGIWAVNNSQNLLMSSRAQLTFSYAKSGSEWYITRISGPVGLVTTEPSSVSKGAEVTVKVFTVPEGAPFTAYDTQSATLSDWNNNPIALQNQGNGLYSATFSAPSSAGEYTLLATVSDTTFNKTLTLQHKFIVQ